MCENERKLCRICTSEEEDTIPLFSVILPNGETLAVDFLRQITNLKIPETDSLPGLICTTCLTRTSECFDLIQLCIASDNLLRQLLSSHPNNVAEIQQKENIEARSKSELNGPEPVLEDQAESSKPERQSCPNSKATFTTNQYNCSEFPLVFSEKLDLNDHPRPHTKTEERKFICKTCDKQFIYFYLLKQHEYKHSEEKPFPCSVCNRGCLTAESLRRHMKIHEENYVRKSHPCNVCSRGFPYPSLLAEHMKIHTGEKPYLCSICGKGFRQSGALHYHQRGHRGDKPFTCNICNGKFISPSVLKVHMRKHTNERPYVCHICGVAFRQSTDLRSHQRTHSGERPVLCTICGKRMSTTGQLTIHIRSHTGEKPFTCSQCLKAFSTNAMLVKHLRVHTGERPYVCDICGKSFGQTSTLKTHQNVHLNIKTKRRRRKPEKNTIDQEAQKFTNNLQDVQIKTENGNIRKQFTVILPAPIPLVKEFSKGAMPY